MNVITKILEIVLTESGIFTPTLPPILKDNAGQGGVRVNTNMQTIVSLGVRHAKVPKMLDIR